MRFTVIPVSVLISSSFNSISIFSTGHSFLFAYMRKVIVAQLPTACLLYTSETGLDATRNIGIRGDRIMEITEKELSGKQTYNVAGLVVAPGFIDLHVHGMTNEAHEYQCRDGVTTALELESGVPFLRDWIEAKRGKTIVNYGATVPHAVIRALAMERYMHHFSAVSYTHLDVYKRQMEMQSCNRILPKRSCKNN